MVAFFAVPGMYPAMAELDDYSFEAQAGETVTWNVKRRLGDGGNVTSQPTTSFDAVVKARGDMNQRLQKESTEMNQLLQVVNQQLTQLAAEREQDLEAMTRRAEELELLAVQKRDDVVSASGRFQDLSVRARVVRDEMASRRDDVVRLRQELEELRTHLYELTELRRTLMDRLLRLELDNQNLQQREAQVQQQLTK